MTALKDTFIKIINVSKQNAEEIHACLNKNSNDLSELDCVKELKLEIEKNRAVIFRLNKSEPIFNYQSLHQLNPLLGKVFGDLLIQNEQGDQVISVYDRDRYGSMHRGARYHQTREGGSIHTDNVNIPEVWDYLYLACLSPGHIGGENIFVDGLSIHDQLKKDFPDVLSILESSFIWEMRGVAESLYEAPIITYNDSGEALFRHLRPYMESAHLKADKPLTSEQLYAIDVLDALTNSSTNQTRFLMESGDILISKDAQVLHGRTCFSDHLEAVSYEEYQQGKGPVMKRTMERLWIKK